MTVQDLTSVIAKASNEWLVKGVEISRIQYIANAVYKYLGKNQGEGI